MDNEENKAYECGQCRGNDYSRWYSPVNPNESVYTPGYGFLPHSPRMIERRMISSCCTGLVICLVFQFVIAYYLPYFALNVFDRFFPPALYSQHMEISYQLALMLGTIGSLSIPFFIYAKLIKIPKEYALPYRGVSVKLTLLTVFIALGVSVIGSYCVEALYGLSDLVGIYFETPDITLPDGVLPIIAYILNITLVPAVFEELAFRGIIMQSLRRFGDGFALIVSAVLFALVHVSPLMMPNAFLMGLVIGYFVLFTGSVYTGIIIHMVHNLLVTALSQLTWLSPTEFNFVISCLYIVYLLLGIFSCIYLMRNYRNTFNFPPSKTVNTSGQKLISFFCTLPFFLFFAAILYTAGGYII